jgi:hypothetical protein
MEEHFDNTKTADERKLAKRIVLKNRASDTPLWNNRLSQGSLHPVC